MSNQRPWNEIIDDAEKRGFFTDEEKSMAASWPTCACGQLDEGIARDIVDNAPKDRYLKQLGLYFCSDVSLNKFAGARDSMSRIIDRAVYLLNEGRPNEQA